MTGRMCSLPNVLQGTGLRGAEVWRLLIIQDNTYRKVLKCADRQRGQVSSGAIARVLSISCIALDGVKEAHSISRSLPAAVPAQMKVETEALATWRFAMFRGNFATRHVFAIRLCIGIQACPLCAHCWPFNRC